MRLRGWQNTNHPVELDTDEAFFRAQEYIHDNPVEAGLVTVAEAYVWSSANPEIGVALEEW